MKTQEDLVGSTPKLSTVVTVLKLCPVLLTLPQLGVRRPRRRHTLCEDKGWRC